MALPRASLTHLVRVRVRVRVSRSRSTRHTLTLSRPLSLTLTLTLRTSRGQGRRRAASMTARQPAGRSCEGGRASASAPRGQSLQPSHEITPPPHDPLPIHLPPRPRPRNTGWVGLGWVGGWAGGRGGGAGAGACLGAWVTGAAAGSQSIGRVRCSVLSPSPAECFRLRRKRSLELLLHNGHLHEVRVQLAEHRFT